MRDIILLVVDALRYNRCGFAGYERNTTPFLDDFAEEYTSFDQAYSTSSHTREAVSGFLTGKLPFQAVNNKYELQAETIAEVMKEQGYQTAGFHSNVFLSKAYGYGKGFDIFYDSFSFSGSKISALGQKAVQKISGQDSYTRAEKLNEMALEWWNNTEGDKFMWLQYMDVHGPYEPKKGYRNWTDKERDRKEEQQLYEKMANGNPEKVTEEEEQLASDLYDCELRYIDQQIEKLLLEIADGNLNNLEDTLVIITSDHGEAFGSLDNLDYYDHPRELDGELLHVPFLVNKDLEERKISTAEIFDLIRLQELPQIPKEVVSQVRKENGDKEKSIH